MVPKANQRTDSMSRRNLLSAGATSLLAAGVFSGGATAKQPAGLRGHVVISKQCQRVIYKVSPVDEPVEVELFAAVWMPEFEAVEDVERFVTVDRTGLTYKLETQPGEYVQTALIAHQTEGVIAVDECSHPQVTDD